MNIDAILESALDRADINKAVYWTSDPTDVEIMSAPGNPSFYLITHETKNLEICLVTVPAKAFARCRKTGAYLERKVSRMMCDQVQKHFRKMEGGEMQ